MELSFSQILSFVSLDVTQSSYRNVFFNNIFQVLSTLKDRGYYRVTI